MKTQAMLQSPQPLPPEVVLTALINEIAVAPAPFILVLDDYHVIESLPVQRQTDFLVQNQPPQMHLVIITREDPPLPLARLRARSQMVEIRQDDLRFSLEECADFLQRIMGLNLSADDIANLERRTEGWIAGLQLAALSMQGCADLPGFIKAFSGSSHFILEYLIEEVFERQSADEQDFLLKTAILDRLCGPLCDALTGRTDGGHILSRFEHANLFVVPIDQTHTWYRYPHLFAELLRQRLRTTAGLHENELHRSASQWLAAEGFLTEAIQHALDGSDWNRAADLIASNSVMMLRTGELVTLLGWLKRLPDQTVFPLPQLCRDYGWALTLTGQLDAATIYLQQAEATAKEDKALLGTILVAQAYNQRSRGDNLGAIDSARRALALLPQTDPLSRGLVALTLGFAYWSIGSFREAEQAFIEVDQAAQLSQNHFARLTALTHLGLIQTIYGKLHRAAELCRQVLQLGGESPPVSHAHIELGALLYEWNDLESADRHLQTGIELGQHTGNPGILCDGYRTLALVQLALEKPEAALLTLQKAEQLASKGQVSPATRMRNAACHVQLALAQKDLPAAQSWAEQVTEPADSSLLFPMLAFTPARLRIARGEKAEAAELLIGLSEMARESGLGSALVEVRTLQALAATTPGEALFYLEDALQKAQPEGFIRTFIDKGESLKVLLEKLKPQSGGLKKYIQTILAAFGEVGKSPIPQPLIEPLSERELEVLRLMAQGLSNAEIAQRLIVTVGTVKTHVHSILEKMGATNRSQAVARARELHLLQ